MLLVALAALVAETFVVPPGGAAEACAARVGLTVALADVLGHEVLRTDEAIEGARRLDARATAAGIELWVGAEPRTAASLGAALAAALPLPAGVDAGAVDRALGPPSEWAVACGGPSVPGLGLVRLLHDPSPSPSPRPRALLERLRLARAEPPKTRAPELRELVRRLAAGDSAPMWVAAPSPAFTPGVLTLALGLAVGFDGGELLAFDLGDGRLAWRVAIGVAEPTVVAAGGSLLAFGTDRVLGLDPASGQIRWQHPFVRPWPEVASWHGDVVIADAKDLMRLDPDRGEPRWRVELADDPTAGPIAIGDDLLLPTEHAVLRLDGDGQLRERVELSDELASPLFAAERDLVALVGGDRVVRVDLRAPRATLRQDAGLAGAAWPPVAAGPAVFVGGRDRRGGYLARLDPATGPTLDRRGEPPILPLPSFAGVVHLADRGRTVVARSVTGEVRFRRSFRAPRPLGATEDWIAIADGATLFRLDLRTGAPLGVVELEAPIVGGAVTPAGGAIATLGGVVAGIATGHDPRPAIWLRLARLELARAELLLGRAPAAIAAAEAALARAPDDVVGLGVLLAARIAARDRRATETALALLARTPPASPLHQAALAHLGSSGLLAYRRLARPAVGLRVASGTVAIDLGDVLLHLDRRGQPLASPAGSVEATPAPSGPPENASTPNIFVETKESGTTLSVRTPSGALEPRGEVAAATSSRILVRRGDELEVYDLDGRSRLRVRRPERPAILAVGDLFVLDGRSRLEAIVADRPPVTRLSGGHGALTRAGASRVLVPVEGALVLLDLATGATRRLPPLPVRLADGDDERVAVVTADPPAVFLFGTGAASK